MFVKCRLPTSTGDSSVGGFECVSPSQLTKVRTFWVWSTVEYKSPDPTDGWRWTRGDTKATPGPDPEEENPSTGTGRWLRDYPRERERETVVELPS